MTDTTLESTYIEAAITYIITTGLEETVQAGFINGVQYGLDLREAEVAELKARITELGG